MSDRQGVRLFDCWGEVADRYPARPALALGERTMSYGELRGMAGRCSAAMVAAGVKWGDRVGVLMRNSPEWAALWWGIGQLGAAVVAMNGRLTPRELVDIAADARLSHLFCDLPIDLKEFESVVPVERIYGPEGANDGRFLVFGEGGDDARMADHRESVSADDPALVVYTSGTTGRPKGVVLTHRNIVSSIVPENVWFGAGPGKAMLCALPFSHVGGATESLAATLASGGCLVLQQKFDPAGMLETIEKRSVTSVGGVPTMFAMLLSCPGIWERDLRSLERVFVAGAPFSERLFEGIRRLAPVVQTGYGMTEASGFVTYTGADDPPERARDTVGRVDGSFGLRIVDDDRQPVPPGRTGEVAIRGDCITAGYLFNEEATAAVIDAQGWYYTGDLGFLDPEGCLRLVGRKKEMYITGGYNVYPAEVQAHLERHPGVAMSACMGVADETMGEVGWAFVISHSDPLPTPEELEAHCRRGLARYKIPAKFIVRRELPLTALGKIDKQSLRREVGSQM